MANVLSLVPYRIFPSNLGGQRVIASFNKYLSRHHKLSAVMVKGDQPHNAPYRIFNLFSNNRSRYLNIFLYFSIKQIVRDLAITHVIVEHPFIGWLGVMLKRFCKVKLIVHSHNIEAIRFKTVGKSWWKLLWYYERWIHKNADLTFCITPEDREYMIAKYGVEANKCHVVTYGVEWDSSPVPEEKNSAKKQLQRDYSIPDDRLLFLFNGALSYGPNLDAVKAIISKIHPLLRSKLKTYTIFICGKGLPEEDRIIVGDETQQIIYTGFVTDIGMFFKGCDVFINPVNSGGGIKTKLVEALAANLNAVSSKTGAIGIDPKCCNGKLLIADDQDWEQFVKQMIVVSQNKNTIGPDFFEKFNLDNIIRNAATLIN